MFTGIVERTAVLAGLGPVAHAARRLRLTGVGPVGRDAVAGDSICVSGVCLTVAAAGADALEFDVIQETLDRTTLGELRSGARVNLERALPVGGRLDGHFVQGHVDGAATVTRRIADAREHVLGLRPQGGLFDAIVPKGSIAIDGVSLTIAAVEDGEFSVALIPTTLERTTLGELRVGARVNVETDILARTVMHLLRRSGSAGDKAGEGVTFDRLRQAGFA
ncbi:MAG: riboflavin synthase [Phycisphaerales bacterium]|nr:MAG: riboflavin synthase [Phycisphaerales bacterium]